MIVSIVVTWCLLHVTKPGVSAQAWDNKVYPENGPEPEKKCLIGYMTDVQRWVDSTGSISKSIDPFNVIDLSSKTDVVSLLTQEVSGFRSNTPLLKYLSLARCRLNRVPTVFQLKDTRGRHLYDTVEYITLYGNDFVDVSAPGEQYGMIMNATGAIDMGDDYGVLKRQGITVWSVGFQRVTFSQLRELDLRKCSIQILSDNLFSGMPKLEALYLGENAITIISPHAFNGLTNLQHLDLSRNVAYDDYNLIFESTEVFRNLRKLKSLDLSFTIIHQRNVGALENLGLKLERLSLCYTGLKLRPFIFNTTSMRYLDLSGNSGTLSTPNVLCGIEDTLQVLYADQVGLNLFEIFYKFEKLEVLKLRNNELNVIPSRTAHTLNSLQILDLEQNRIVTWFGKLFSSMQKLRYLSLKDNSINLISDDVLADFKNISYLAFSGNYVVCNCQARELYEIGLKNENSTQPKLQSLTKPSKNRYTFHTGFLDYNIMVQKRNKMKRICSKSQPCEYIESEIDGNFVLVDYNSLSYRCLVIANGNTMPFRDVLTCQQSRNGKDYEQIIASGWRKYLALIIIAVVLFPILIFTYLYRKNFRYFCITMRNSATLSLINKGGVKDETTIYNYDVFVSYCNEDRNWVLDYLLPHVEKNCNVSVCLHERDFQVGLSILENIVSCMDRSRSIMLILSQRFLLSQWCQFEMHLAQHRLLETRREDLILVLLEDIPRRLRPTTLQYLMLTKTYIVWPKVKTEQTLFWKRLKKSLTTYRLNENVSLA